MKMQRPIFIRPPRPDGLAPIYLALLAIVILSAMGFGIALWPSESVARSAQPQDAERMNVGCPVEGDVHVPASVPAPVRRSHWM